MNYDIILLPLFSSSIFIPSFFNISTFIDVPPLNPPILPSDLITRWQGITIGNGLLPIAVPTALYALLLMDFAISF